MKNLYATLLFTSSSLAVAAMVFGTGCPGGADETICCEVDGVYSYQPQQDCEKLGGNVALNERCEETPEQVCCLLDDGTASLVPADECDDANVVADGMCAEDVCCLQADGTVTTVPQGECDAANIVDDEQCSEEVCCRLDDGSVVTTTASECDTTDIVADEECAEEVCCIQADGTVSTVPQSECDAINIVADEQCKEDVCCMQADGTVTVVPEGECDAANIVADEQCAEELCCRLDDGSVATLPASDCDAVDIVPDAQCLEEVCCMQADGSTTTVPVSECDAPNIVADEQCEPQECVKFRAVDMGALPYTTTSGDTLQSVASLGIYPLTTGWSATCLDVPAGTQRAFAGVGNDAVLTFSAPVSSLYVLRYHGQVGDDLIVPGGAVAPTFCGADAYNDVAEVTLTTPSATVTVQDISPDGGSGYSVLLAECIEWGPLD